MLWFVFILLMVINGVPSSKCNFDHKTSNTSCPPWSEHADDGECKCRDVYTPLILCYADNNVSLPYCNCMSYNKEFNKTVFGYCAIRCYVSLCDPGRKKYTGFHRYQVIVNSFNLSEFNDETCRSLQLNRTGQLCGKCLKGFAPPVYSYSLACVNCTDYKYNWIKYIAVAYLPLTVFFVIVITFRISAASGAKNGYILVTQVIVSHTELSLLNYSNHKDLFNNEFKTFTTFYGIWNLDFFRALYTPFCLHPNISAIQTRALDYGVAVYPLLLVIVTYIFASLHYRYPRVVSLWKPFYKCFRCLRKEWDIKNSLIGAFDTFILLSYVKILNVSLHLLTPVTLYDIGNEHTLNQLYLNMDGSVKYLGKEHLPYAILAVVMTFLFNIIPLLLLCLFPNRCCFHRCLNFFQVKRETLREFVAVFLCEFRDQPRDYRYFAAFYLLLRIANLLMLFLSKATVHFVFIGALFAVSAVLIATFKPYRKPQHNYIDIVLMSVGAIICLGPPTQELHMLTESNRNSNYYFYLVMWYVIVLFHPLYGVCMLIGIFLPMQKLQECFTKIKASIHINATLEPEDRPPYRLDHMDEYPPLLPHVEP